MLSSVLNAKGLKDAEGRRVVNFRVRPEDDDLWVAINLVALDSFKDNTVNLLVPIEGASVAGKDEILLDKKVLEKVDVSVGENLIFELTDGTFKILKVAGIVQDVSTGAGDFLSPPFAFTVMDTMETLRQPELYNRVYATERKTRTIWCISAWWAGTCAINSKRMALQSSAHGILKEINIRWKIRLMRC